MQTIKTAKGHLFPVRACGVSGISGQLFMDITGGATIGAIIAAFDSPEETETLIYSDERIETVYRGYTRIAMCGSCPNGAVRLCLERPKEAE